jgi:hypothetical protein
MQLDSENHMPLPNEPERARLVNELRNFSLNLALVAMPAAARWRLMNSRRANDLPLKAARSLQKFTPATSAANEVRSTAR